MDLRAYIVNREARRELSAALEVPDAYLWQMATNRRPVSPERCVDVERLTSGAVTRMDLRPDDWHRIWPELAAAHPDRVPPDHRPEPASVGGR